VSNAHLHYEHIPHPHITARRAQGPVKVADQHPTDSPVNWPAHTCEPGSDRSYSGPMPSVGDPEA
jgi:hypothetical protein